MKYRIKVNPSCSIIWRYTPQYKKMWFLPWVDLSSGESSVENAKILIEKMKEDYANPEVTF